jgi:subtilisin family serine protease
VEAVLPRLPRRPSITRSCTARASNNSWGGGGFDNLLFNAINTARTTDFGGGKIGQVFIAAAGNSGVNIDNSPFYPASYSLSNVLPVAATDSTGAKAGFSNFGATTVKVAGPGVHVLSTTRNNTYSFFDGTSMATPHVTGTIGLMLTQDPSLTATQIISRIVNSVTPDSSLAGLVASGGIVSAAGALEPAVKSETPGPGATSVPVNTTVQAVFTKSVQASSISFVLQDTLGNPVPATVAYNDTTHTATLTPNAVLASSATYTATVSGAQDQFGVGMTAPVTWSFSTGTTVPTVIAKTPAAGATGVPTTTTVTATFNESVVASSIVFTLQDPSGKPVPASFAYNDGTHTATLTPSSPLALVSTYTATISGAKDAAGNVMPSPVSWSFTTEAAPAVTSETPAPGATNVPTNVPVTATFNKSVVSASIAFALKDAAGNPVLAALSYSDSTHTATLTPTTLLAPATLYTATVSGAKDASGNVMPSPVSWSFTTEAAPAITAVSPAPGATGVPTTYNAFATFNKSVVASSIVFVLKDPAGNTVAATLSYSDATHTVTLSPSAALANSTTYTATVSAAKDASGNALAAPFSWSFTTAAVSTGPFSIFAPTATPTTSADPDTGAVEVGVKFQSDVAGFITGIRFYKDATNTGTHVANLWASDGTLLATATFTAESASGWQQVNFATPVAINANTTYVASYHTNVGHYADDQNFFATGFDNAPLHALADGSSGGNGVYAYGSGSNFLNQTWFASNYWVDVVFSKT